MFKKLFSIASIMLFGFTFTLSAQQVSKAPVKERIACVKNYARTPITSTVEKKSNELWTGYWDGSMDNLDQVGAVDIPMEYGVAMKILAGDNMVADRTVEGIKFLFADHKNVENVYVWMSTTLPETPDKADICYQKVTDVTSFANNDDFINEVRFNNPYKVDAEKDFYVGYSFSINTGSGDDEKYPVVFYDSEDISNSLYMLCGSDGWDNYSNDNFGPAAIQILVSGEFPSDAVEFTYNENIMAPKSEDFIMPLKIKNLGTNGIQNMNLVLDYSNGESYKYDIKPLFKIEGMYTEFEFQIKAPAPDAVEKYTYTLTIEKVNGKENIAKGKTVEGEVQVLTRLAERKVLFEEFTGMWCGWCPRGMIAMEMIGEKYGDKVARVAVHFNDKLKCKDYTSFVQNTVHGFPNAHVNRTFMGIDPYYGKDITKQFGVKEYIDDCLTGAPEAELSSTALIDGSVITATTDVTFLYSGDASDYALAYVLTEDGMENEKWTQTNNYYQYAGQDIEPAFIEWANADYKATGVVYNEVAIAAKGIENGIANSVPTTVKEEEKNEHVVEFNVDDYPIIQNTTKLNFISILFNTKTEQVVNVQIVPVKDVATGICDVNVNDGNAVEVARYNAEGRRISNAEKGLNIVKYSDGSVKKIMIK